MGSVPIYLFTGFVFFLTLRAFNVSLSTYFRAFALSLSTLYFYLKALQEYKEGGVCQEYIIHGCLLINKQGGTALW